MTDNLLEVQNLKQHFPIYGGIFRRKVGTVYALNGVSFSVKKGETIGIVGESGCGKTTVGRAVLRLYDPTEGQIRFGNQDITRLPQKQLRQIRREMQMIFQDPFESLNARHTVGQILDEPFIIHNIQSPSERKDTIKKLLDRVGFAKNVLDRYPHEFSGGQRQRIGIARAIALKPKLVICDEPVSALDVSIQSQILNLLMELQKEMDLTYIFIAHDLAVVRTISDRIAVMYLGHIVEFTDADTLLNSPVHPYTQALISAIPVPDPTVRRKKVILEGDVPSPIHPPPGCCFHTRCPVAEAVCKTEVPELKPQGNIEHLAACHLAGQFDSLL